MHFEKNESGHFRGLHIVVVNPSKARVELAKVFDTYKTADGFDDFIASDIPEGHIVVAACKDDCASNLSPKARQWFVEMGSKEIVNLEYRQGFAFIGTMGRHEAYEKRALEKRDQVRLNHSFIITLKTYSMIERLGDYLSTFSMGTKNDEKMTYLINFLSYTDE